MKIQYEDSATAEAVANRARAFVDEVIIPFERDQDPDEHVTASEIADLREAARDYDVYAPQMPEEYGGLGLSFRDVLPVFEQAGRSLYAVPAMRVDAPDEGNMNLLELAGSDDQKERWLRPLVEGSISSCFSMTEPAPGGGSDPKMIRTSAERRGDEWVIRGHKWWSTNAAEADVFLVLARTDQDAHPYSGSSIFLVPADADGVQVRRSMSHLGENPVAASEGEVIFDDVSVPESALLGTINEGFNHAQQRLAPARLTHCMRYSGMASRALEVAKAYMATRDAFGERLSEKQALRFAVADAEIQLHAARSMVRHAADQVSADEDASVPVSMSKVFTANAVQDVIDTAVQVTGASGIGKDLPLAEFYEFVRQFRIVDGPDEVHKRVIARESFRDVDETEASPVTRYDEDFL